MNKHAIIPIFLPHEGCPNDCVFCNQKKITAYTKPLEKEAVCRLVKQYIPTIRAKGVDVIEMAFFGGSFTGIPVERQLEYLCIAKAYKDQGVIQKIRLSTRPDYIDEDVLKRLKQFDVDIIELGVQSLDDEVLRLSKRGHDSGIVYKSAEMIKDWGFELGIQLMTGLPGDTAEKSIDSAKKTADIKPDMARIYPTLILPETELAEIYRRKLYEPWTLEKSVVCVKDMCRILQDASVNIIRIGLKSTDHIANDGDVIGGNYHPAFRQLVEGELAKEMIAEKLQKVLQAEAPARTKQEGCEEIRRTGAAVLMLECSQKDFSNMIGHRGVNKHFFEKQYPQIKFVYKINNEIPNKKYNVRVAAQ